MSEKERGTTFVEFPLFHTGRRRNETEIQKNTDDFAGFSAVYGRLYGLYHQQQPDYASGESRPDNREE